MRDAVNASSEEALVWSSLETQHLGYRDCLHEGESEESNSMIGRILLERASRLQEAKAQAPALKSEDLT